MNFKKHLLFFLVLFPVYSFAQWESIPSGEIQKSDSTSLYIMSDVLVTATKTERSSLEIASSVSIIDSNEISWKKKNTVYDLLKNEYGLSLTQQGGPGSLSYIYTRGANSGHTLVLLDGIEVNMPNEPNNAFDFANLPTDNIERIEILRGPQSTLYGSDALAGVINIITKKGAGKPKFYLSTEGGSFNSYKGLGGLDGSYDFLNYSLSISKFKTDGISAASEKYGNKENDGSSKNIFTSRIGANITDDLNLDLFFRFTKADADLDQFGGEFGDDPTYFFNLEEGAYRAAVNYSAFNGFWNQSLGVSFLRNVRKYKFDVTPFNPSSSRSFYDGKKLKIDWQNNFYLTTNNIVTMGVETEEEKAISEYYSFSDAFNFVSIFPENSSRTTGAYLQNQLNIFGNFFNTFGIRYDNHERFGSQVTYRIAPAYIFWETGTKLKANYGTGFKAPSLFYLFDPSYGNANLNPEKSTGWDAGIEQYFSNSKVIIGLTYFQNSFEELFGFDANFKTINIDKAESSGIEFYFLSNPLKEFHLKTNFTYTNTKNKSENSPDRDKLLLRRPKVKISSSVNYIFQERANLNVEVIFVGQRDDMNFSIFPAVRVNLKSYTLVNLSASYDVLKFLQLYGRIDNLFDTEYEDVLGFGTPGFSGYLGFKVAI